MRVCYIGPLLMGLNHPALSGIDTNYFSETAFAVEVSEDAGCDGPLIEGDVLIAEEKTAALHDDLAIVDIDGQYRAMRAFRVGSRMRLISLGGGESFFADSGKNLLGVVVRQVRIYNRLSR